MPGCLALRCLQTPALAPESFGRATGRLYQFSESEEGSPAGPVVSYFRDENAILVVDKTAERPLDLVCRFGHQDSPDPVQELLRSHSREASLQGFVWEWQRQVVCHQVQPLGHLEDSIPQRRIKSEYQKLKGPGPRTVRPLPPGSYSIERA